MSRLVALTYGLVTYAIFGLTFVYLIGWLGNWFVPTSIDSGAAGPLGQSVLINVALLGLFAVQHMVMARPWFKAWLTKFVPKPMERATFVLATCGVLWLMVWQWRPLPEVVWHVDHEVARWLLIGLSLAGWGLVLYASFLIDHFDLFGLRQVVLHWRNRAYTSHPFMQRSVYKFIQHPLMTGFLMAFWFTPTMTQGHLLFAVVTTAYIVVGTRVEERDLLRHLGEDYAEYRRTTPRFLPRPGSGQQVAPQPVRS